VKTGSEACDDGDTDPNDGCDGCKIVAAAALPVEKAGSSEAGEGGSTSAPVDASTGDAGGGCSLLPSK